MVFLPAALLALSVLPAVAVAVAAPFALPQTTDQCPTCPALVTDLQSCNVSDADLNTGLTISQWACLCGKSGFASTAATCLTCSGTPTTEADMQSNCVSSVSSQSASVSSKSASSVSPSRTTTPTGSAARTSTSSSQSTSESTSTTPGSSTPRSSTTSSATGTSPASPSGSGLRTATATATGDAVANNIPGAAVPIFVAALIYQLVWGF